VSPVEQELLTLPEHLSSLPDLVEFVLRNLWFSVFCGSLLDLLPFLLAIVLYVPLLFTASDYPFGIFKLFFCFRLLITPLVSSNFSSVYGF
jgi:hypothetical protein